MFQPLDEDADTFPYTDFQTCLDDFGMVQMVSKPTRGDNILDLFLTSNHTLVNTVQKKEREKSRECHNHKPQPFPDPKRKRKPTNPNKHKSNKCTKSTKISSLFPKRGNRNTKRTEKQVLPGLSDHDIIIANVSVTPKMKRQKPKICSII